VTPPILWQPSRERTDRATITRYARWLNETRGLALDDYHALWRWSVEDLEGFWASIWDFFGVDSRYDSVLASREMPGAQWFPGARVNYAAHLFRGKDANALAIQHASEVRELSSWTWGQLRVHTARIRDGLLARGVQPGDRVAAYLPNIPETIAAFLATASLGAIWSSAAPEFGAPAVIDRFTQIRPKVLLAIDAHRYGGADFDRTAVVERIAAETGAHVVRLGYLDGSGWERGFADGGAVPALEFAQLPFDHPLWVLYSSGTTGLPKPIVHGHGGILLEHLKTMHLHLEAQASDRVFWFTTTGWMMWNFLAGVLLTDASIVLYDGNPGHPSMDVLWDLAEQTGITTFGTSAAYIGACMQRGVKPARGRELDIGAVGSTGSPLSPEGFDWISEQLGSDTWLFSTSGGTDLCTAFVGGVPILPVYRGELQARSLGARVEAWDDAGNSVIDQVGELVITKPMPSMPVGFWGDDGGERYRESYFSHYPGVWRHGDWIELTDRGTAIIHGRSDATINRGGVRMGTSEIYRAVLAFDEIVDALVVDVPRPKQESWMPLFVVLSHGSELNEDLAAAIKTRIREDCSPRHVPNDIVAIPEVPRTLSGKVVEVPVKSILMGIPVEQAASRGSVANPSALDWFADFASQADTAL
jgi:acetoacetyl-CoA synthetase